MGCLSKTFYLYSDNDTDPLYSEFKYLLRVTKDFLSYSTITIPLIFLFKEKGPFFRTMLRNIV